jgi:hypothetical protein
MVSPLATNPTATGEFVCAPEIQKFVLYETLAPSISLDWQSVYHNRITRSACKKSDTVRTERPFTGVTSGLFEVKTRL